jgi:hypothetical protein
VGSEAVRPYSILPESAPPAFTITGMSEGFVAYRGDPDFHDGKVVAVHHEGDTARVVVKAESGRVLEVRFSGVDSLRSHKAEGMTLYSLTEVEAPTPLRRFVFANWDEEDDARLEVVALDFDWRDLPPQTE